MTRPTIRMLFRGLLLVGLLGFPSESSAGSYTYSIIAPGLACKWYGKLGVDTYFNPSGFSANGVKNTSGTAKYLSCPIIKKPSNATDVAWAIMNTSSGSCELWTRGYSATTHWTTSSISAVESGYWKYEFDASSNFNTANQSASVFCSVPADAALIQYGHIWG